MAERDLTLRFKVTDEGTILLDKISQKISNVDSATQKMSGSLSLIKWDSIVNLGARALHAGEQFYGFAKSVVSSLNDIDRQSKVLGMSTDQFQKWQYAAKMSDVEAEELAKGFKFLSRNMSEAAQGSGGAYDAFKAMGVEVVGTAGKLKPLNEMMKEVMDKFAGWADGPEKIAISLALFGRSGEALIPLLNKGAVGFAEFAKEAERLGVILGKDLIEGGSKAEDIFKKLEVQWVALKLSIAPVATAGASFLGDLVGDLKWAYYHVKELAGEMRALKEGKILTTRPLTTAVFGIEEGMAPERAAPSLISEAQRKKISEIKTLISNMGWEDYAAGAALATDATRAFNKMLIETRGPIEELNNAFKGLGVESSAALRLSTDITFKNLEIIEKAFQAGQVTALDYAKALKAALSETEKVTGPDITKKLIDLMAESDKKISEISPEDPDRQKKIQAYIDDWSKAREEIQSLDPISLVADIDKMESELNRVKDKAKSILGEILPDPISVTADISQLESAFDSAERQFQELKRQIENPIRLNISATIESSPKKPFSEGIADMIKKFGGLQNLMENLEANIRFSEFSRQTTLLQRELAKVQDVLPSIRKAISAGGGLEKRIDQSYQLKIGERESDLLSQIAIMQQKMFIEMLKMYGGSFQAGTQRVPKTALYTLHEGEKVIPKGVSMSVGDIHISVDGGGDPRKTVDMLVKTLKYRLSGELKNLL